MAGSKIISIGKIGLHWDMENPFIFCAHHKDDFPKGNQNQGPHGELNGRNLGNDFVLKNGFRMYHGIKVPGFPKHPHRGFETVTIVEEGFVDHFDSKGASGRYGNGDVQWLTTGEGCQHAEMFPLVSEDAKNPLEIFQVWLNLPAKSKFVKPAYKMLWSEKIPYVYLDGQSGEKGNVKVITGTFNDVKSLDPCPDSYAFKRENKVGIYLIELEADGFVEIPKGSDTLVRNLYYFEGEDSCEIEGHSIPSGNRVKLIGSENIVVKSGKNKCRMLLLEGEPINEPVVTGGPFVMNTREEIQKAYDDYHATEFGGWPFDRTDPVNERNVGRFARYEDGTLERP